MEENCCSDSRDNWRGAEQEKKIDPNCPEINYAELANLLLHAVKGDTGAFKRWVSRTTPLVYRLCFRMLLSTADAEDAVQETYIRAWQSILSLREFHTSVAWVCRIARNVSTDFLRSRSRGRLKEVDIELSDLNIEIAQKLVAERSNPEELMEKAESRFFVRNAIDSLPEKHRVILSLREIDGLSYEDIGAALGCPMGTIDSRLFRARASLKKRIIAFLNKAQNKERSHR